MLRGCLGLGWLLFSVFPVEVLEISFKQFRLHWKENCDCGKRCKGNPQKVRIPYDNAIPPVLTRRAFQDGEGSRGDYLGRSMPHIGSPFLRAAGGDSS